jgi:hypothetical protein
MWLRLLAGLIIWRRAGCTSPPKIFPKANGGGGSGVLNRGVMTMPWFEIKDGIGQADVPLQASAKARMKGRNIFKELLIKTSFSNGSLARFE